MATGNTIGKLQYAPAPQGHVAAGSANPPKKKSRFISHCAIRVSISMQKQVCTITAFAIMIRMRAGL